MKRKTFFLTPGEVYDLKHRSPAQMTDMLTKVLFDAGFDPRKPLGSYDTSDGGRVYYQDDPVRASKTSPEVLGMHHLLLYTLQRAGFDHDYIWTIYGRAYRERRDPYDIVKEETAFLDALSEPKAEILNGQVLPGQTFTVGPFKNPWRKP